MVQGGAINYAIQHLPGRGARYNIEAERNVSRGYLLAFAEVMLIITKSKAEMTHTI